MRPIPLTLRKLLAEDPWMSRCVWTDSIIDVTWEHPWIYAGRQINERWSIVPLKRDLNVNITPKIKEYCRWVSLLRMTPAELQKAKKDYPKLDFDFQKKRLDKMFLV